MMSVREYAIDVNLSVSTIMDLCKKLNISVSSEEEYLDDEAIIMLDNEVANVEETEEVLEELDTLEDEEESSQES